MMKALSELTLAVCKKLLGEYAAKGDNLDRIIFKGFEPSETHKLLKVLDNFEKMPDAVNPQDLISLSRLFTTIGAYTSPFIDTKAEFGQDGIYNAADEFVAYVETISQGRVPTII